MSTIGTVLLRDMKDLLNRPLFTKEEEQVLVALFDEKIVRAFNNSTEMYINEIRNLKDLMDFAEGGGDLYDMWDGR